jgi:hypothetical protein
MNAVRKDSDPNNNKECIVIKKILFNNLCVVLNRNQSSQTVGPSGGAVGPLEGASFLYKRQIYFGQNMGTR